MKRTKKFLVILFVFALFSASAIASDFGFSAGVDAVTKYLWRGRLLHDKFAVQPGFEFALGGINASFWGSYHPDTGEFSESDYTFSYSDTIPGADALSLGTGFTIYTFPYVSPESGNNSTEIFFSLSADIAAAPSVTFYYDPVGGNGGYLEAAASHDFDLTAVAVSAGITAGYNFGQWGYEKSFSVLTASASVSYPVEGFSFSLGATGQLALDAQYENDIFGIFSAGYEM